MAFGKEQQRLEILYARLKAALGQVHEVRDLLHYDYPIDEKVRLLAIFLATSPLMDWQAYLRAYPDVASFPKPAPVHYLQYGIHEGRKLFFRDGTAAGASPGAEPGAPLVSIIIPNYNKGPYLKKSIGSALSQTLAQIEVIVVDDGSTDASVSLIEAEFAGDRRLKIIRHPVNRSQHMAKKTGVAASLGKYVMFLDPDDYYEPQACAVACKAMEAGDDIAFFNTNVINANQMPEASVERIISICNDLPAGQYQIRQLLQRELTERHFMHNLCNKIFRGETCRQAFAAMEDGHFTEGEDFYEFLMLAGQSETLLKIDDILYNYNYGLGITSERLARKNAFDHSILLSPLAHGLDRLGLGDLFPHVKAILFSWSVGALTSCDSAQFHDLLANQRAAYNEEYFYSTLYRFFGSRCAPLLSRILNKRGFSGKSKRVCLAVDPKDQYNLSLFAAQRCLETRGYEIVLDNAPFSATATSSFAELIRKRQIGIYLLAARPDLWQCWKIFMAASLGAGIAVFSCPGRDILAEARNGDDSEVSKNLRQCAALLAAEACQNEIHKPDEKIWPEDCAASGRTHQRLPRSLLLPYPEGQLPPEILVARIARLARAFPGIAFTIVVSGSSEEGVRRDNNLEIISKGAFGKGCFASGAVFYPADDQGQLSAGITEKAALQGLMEGIYAEQDFTFLARLMRDWTGDYFNLEEALRAGLSLAESLDRLFCLSRGQKPEQA